MFESLSSRLNDVFSRLTKRGALGEEDVNAAMREVRVALLEADVALPVVKDFISRVKERAVGHEVVRSVTPGQQVIKIVNDNLVEMLGGESEGLSLSVAPPAVVLVVGLQGSGKTTSTAKLALHLQKREDKKVLMASLDTRRPAAQEQLRVLGEQAGVRTLPIVPGEQPLVITRRALSMARLEGFDVLMLDTAGRLHIDLDLMNEAAQVKKEANPSETLLVADAMTGQDAVTIAQEFQSKIGVTGVLMTRIDGDARGGAALSMRAVTGVPIKFAGTGEKLDAIEAFHPERIAGRILGMGDVVSLVEKAAESIEREDAEKLARKVKKGHLDLEDLLGQLRQLKKMGGIGSLMNMLPGVGKLKKQMAGADLDESLISRQEAIILSMTPGERRNPKIIHASRKRRIAAGSGTTVQEINKLLKQFMEMNKLMKRARKMGGKLPKGMNPEDLQDLEKLNQLGGQFPPGGKIR